MQIQAEEKPTFDKIFIYLGFFHLEMAFFFCPDWSNPLNLNEKNVDLSTNNFLNAMNSLLNKYALSKKINKYKLKFKTKPWITFGIQKSVYVKNKLLKKLSNKKDLQIKAECYEKYKKYRNLLSILIKEK